MGFPVQQCYREQKGKRVKTRVGDSIIYLTINEEQPDKLALRYNWLTGEPVSYVKPFDIRGRHSHSPH